MIDFTGKKALITGGSRGIGRACALTLASHGCDVAVTYHTKAPAADEVVKIAQQKGVCAQSFQVDVEDCDSIRSMFASVVADFGPIDILINCAGICEVIAVPDIGEAEWDRMMDINLKGLFFCCQEALAQMMPRRTGSIVNLASTAGQMGGFIVGVNYSASKAGVICLTRSLAKYCVGSGIRVNCVAPGLIDTDMVLSYPPDRVKSLVGGIPMGRMGTAQEVANGVAFLASDAASYVTGTTLFINGGTYLG